MKNGMQRQSNKNERFKIETSIYEQTRRLDNNISKVFYSLPRFQFLSSRVVCYETDKMILAGNLLHQPTYTRYLLQKDCMFHCMLIKFYVFT